MHHTATQYFLTDSLCNLMAIVQELQNTTLKYIDEPLHNYSSS